MYKRPSVIRTSLEEVGLLKYARRMKNFVEEKWAIHTFDVLSRTGRIREPLRYTLEPTLRCNMRCKMCYFREWLGSSSEMTYAQITEAFNRINIRNKLVRLIGGECFVRRDIENILEYFTQREAAISLTTNGTLIDAKLSSKLTNYNIIGLGFSLDGTKELHDAIRGRGTFDKLIKAIKLCRDNFNIGINCVVQNDNIYSLEEIVILAADLGVPSVSFQMEMFSTPKQIEESCTILGITTNTIACQVKNSESYDFSFEDLIINLRKSRRIAENLGIKVRVVPEYFMVYPELSYHRAIRNESGEKLLCYGLLDARIDPQGNVIPCFAIRESVGNILEDKFEAIWNSKYFRRLRMRFAQANTLPICETCCHMRPASFRSAYINEIFSIFGYKVR